jgi:hypothetical protein
LQFIKISFFIELEAVQQFAISICVIFFH